MAGIEPSAGSAGNGCDKALVKTTFGQFKAEVIDPRGTWRSFTTAKMPLKGEN
jgi:hypothetical protein